MIYFEFPNKQIRANAIKEYCEKYNIKKLVCFSCGNASRSLKEVGLDVIDVSPNGDLEAKHWFTQREISELFPDRFDATSGHVPMELMIMISDHFKNYLKEIPEEIYLPTGSGETLVELKLAFPDTKIHAVYNINEATEYSEYCVLNNLVNVLAEDIIDIKETS